MHRSWLFAALATSAACSLVTPLEGLSDAPRPSLEGGASDADTNPVRDDAARATDGGNQTQDTATDVGTACGTSVPDGLLGMWRFEESDPSQVVDCTGHGLLGTVVGHPARAAGHNGKGFSFDGSTYVTLGNPTALRLTGAVTVALWVKLTTFVGEPRFVSKGGSSTLSDEALDLRTQGGVPTFSIGESGTTTHEAAGATFAAETWVHLAGVFRPSSDVSIYVNGTLAGRNETAIPSTMRDSPNPLLIGRRPGDDCCTATGTFDDARIYNRALTPSEIATIAAE
jgi:hypothetical protein